MSNHKKKSLPHHLEAEFEALKEHVLAVKGMTAGFYPTFAFDGIIDQIESVQNFRLHWNASSGGCGWLNPSEYGYDYYNRTGKLP